jgi:mono/diheme cytochrome c family protein
MKLLGASPLWCLLFLASRAAAEPVDYLRDIKPLLAEHCARCHGAAKQRSGLRLDTAAAIRQGGNSGPAIVPGNSTASILVKAVTGAAGVKPMPPKGPRLTARQIALVQAWIDQGARAPAHEKAETAGDPRTRHWAFQPPVRPEPPAVKDRTWIRNPIDCFILARLEREGIRPAPEADRVTLIRRLSLDLLGLPPTIEEVNAFVADRRPDAYLRLVDRLLASPHYGERWGRHWLDLARYADSNGYSIDAPRSIWKYRDWTIDAFNRDLPFDQFAIEQLAGDLLPGARRDQIVATGFHRNTPFNEEGGIDLEQFRVESIVDRVNTTGAVFLGLTIGCAQCHDHKFDPILQREYYQLFAFFNNADEPTLEVPTAEQVRQRQRLRTQVAAIEKQLKVLDMTSPARQEAWEKGLSTEAVNRMPTAIRTILYIPPHQRTPEQHRTLAEAYRNADRSRHAIGGLGNPLPFLAAAHVNAFLTRRAWEKEINKLERRGPEIPTTLVMRERSTPRPTHVHLGGDFLRKGAAVVPDVPAVLGRSREPSGTGESGPARLAGPTRLDLARWLVDPRNPLTARVTMNRFWQHYFGLGLVETENDFGTQGTPPSHPELLDWLATEFMARKWSMKAMHRLIVTSAVYRQSSHARPELAVIDPRNRLLARQARLRLDAEVVRDAALATSGLLSDKMGGPGVFPPQPKGVYSFTQVQREWKESTGEDRHRRGIYTTFWRSAGYPALTVFDAPNAVSACTRRIRSNTPLQALTLLNDQAFFELAQGLATRILHEAGSNPENQVCQAVLLCLSRPPTSKEEECLCHLLEEETAGQQRALTTLARVLLNLDEFITRE